MKDKFIELRVKGYSLGQISKQLNIPKTTLWRWDKEEEARINDLQLAEQEDFEHAWRQQRQNRIAGLQNGLTQLHGVLVDKIQERAEDLPIKDLFFYINLVRAEIDKYRIKPLVRSAAERNGTISPENGTPNRVGDGPSPVPVPGSNNPPRPSSEIPNLAERGAVLPPLPQGEGRGEELGNSGPSTIQPLSTGTSIAKHQSDVCSVERNGTISPQTGTPVPPESTPTSGSAGESCRPSVPEV